MGLKTYKMATSIFIVAPYVATSDNKKISFDLILFQTNKGSSQIRAAIPYLTDQIRAKVQLTIICSGLLLLD